METPALSESDDDAGDATPLRQPPPPPKLPLLNPSPRSAPASPPLQTRQSGSVRYHSSIGGSSCAPRYWKHSTGSL